MTTEQQERQKTVEADRSVDGGAEEPLFADDERSSLNSRWTEIQANFVDEPRQSVEQADALVSEIVDRLAKGFSQARSGLEDQWSQGEEVSTEELRVAIQRYRSFFNRLLAA
jgi:hypothetical protein